MHNSSVSIWRRADSPEFREAARRSIEALAEELAALAQDLPGGLFEAVPLILGSPSPIVVCGIGKSGIIAQKLASSLRSTTTSATFLHAGEAAHGDVGMLDVGGCVILISWSGETEEMLRLIPLIRVRRCSVIAMTGSGDSTLAKLADVVIECRMRRRNGSDWLVPTTSTGVVMALGDALVQVLREAKRVSYADIAQLHPGGAIGDRLKQRVGDAMHSAELPLCGPDDSLAGVTAEMTRGKLGAVLVMAAGELVGIITDGDIRRALERGDALGPARALMSAAPRTIKPGELLAVALARMREARITVLVVANEDSGAVLGMLSIHD